MTATSARVEMIALADEGGEATADRQCPVCRAANMHDDMQASLTYEGGALAAMPTNRRSSFLFPIVSAPPAGRLISLR